MSQNVRTTQHHSTSQITKTIVIMAGGTGGHVFPALAVADQLRLKGINIVWLGTRKGIESQLVPKSGYPISYLSVSGLVGSGLKRKLTAPFMLLMAFLQAWTVLRKVKPQCVLGMGGFASGPGGLAAKFLRKKLIIHEQNAYAGLTNRKLADFADSILTGFRSCEGLPETSIWVGNPVREAIIRSSEGLTTMPEQQKTKDQEIKVLILGGSQGALSLNQMLPSCLSKVASEMKLRVWHQTGINKSSEVNVQYQLLSNFKSVLVEEFINDINVAYHWADLVICRAGAMTIAELTAAGKAAVLVPFPFAAGDHQTKNARFMVNAGAAILAADNSLNSEKFCQQLTSLLSSQDQLELMSNKAAGLFRPKAAEQVADFCLEFLNA